MGLREAILEDVNQQGIEQGIEKGIEQGIELEKKEFVQKLWSFQEFSLDKITLLVDLSPARVVEIILEVLQREGQSEAQALDAIAAYQEKFAAK